MKYPMVALLLVSACTTAAPTGRDAAPAAQDTCDAGAYQNLIGQDAVVDLSLPEPKRTYRLGDPVTTDFDEKRLNIILDETDTIIAINCG